MEYRKYIKLKTGEIYEANGEDTVKYNGDKIKIYLVSKYRRFVREDQIEKVADTLEELK